jgi:hypothetical protein
MESKSRCSTLVKLRSAEADPHVTKRACEPAGEPTDPAPVALRPGTRRCRTEASRERPCSARGTSSCTGRGQAARPTSAPEHPEPSAPPVAGRHRQLRSS